ncbi:MAG: metallophosphoesterase [Gemmatimonadaceae bacterium]
MPRIAWATDVHLEFSSAARIARFTDEVRAASPDVLLLAGDIATARSLTTALSLLEARLPCPTYFVLGNHDFYGGSIRSVRAEVVARTESSASLRWLPTAGVVSLSAETALVGVDGWGDARYGAVWSSGVRLNDFRLILEVSGLDLESRVRRLESLGDEEGLLLRHLLSAAVVTHRRIVVLTHVPPFVEAAWHEGAPSAPDWSPFFACKATGDVLLEIAEEWRDVEFLVLCGHTHGAGEYVPRPNLRVLTGAAEYGEPRVQVVLVLP